ncbi:hypothetical protein [Cohnella silvisoli]|uniref:Uncharacterized protein n=1 Tax=Cohnella silvisoli TaxID=2873699 RepID=A0ABV1L1Y4_9BACL|nr:hypothetical protein [Cohnella silvisoli]MCD9026459.1 hypothetical protein [Cohnella silvisoli]
MESSRDEEESIWNQFIQHELDKVQLEEDSDKSLGHAIAPQALQIAFHHAASYLISRLKKDQEQEDSDGMPLIEPVTDQPLNVSEQYVDVEEEKSTASQTALNTESLTDVDDIKWREFIQHELNKIQPQDEGKSPINTIAPELVQFAFRHLASYLLARLRKTIEPLKGKGSGDDADRRKRTADHAVKLERVPSINVPLTYMSKRSKKRSVSGRHLKRRRRRKAEAKKSFKRRPKPIVRRFNQDLKKSAVKASQKKKMVRSKLSRRRQKSFTAKDINKKLVKQRGSSISRPALALSIGFDSRVKKAGKVISLKKDRVSVVKSNNRSRSLLPKVNGSI